METYKKRYEDALDRAKEAVKNGMVSENFVKDIFKESYETEDERMRKELIEFFSRYYKINNIKAIDVEPWLKWLEKLNTVKNTVKPIWTEDDKRVINCLSDLVSSEIWDSSNEATQKECLSWLDYILRLKLPVWKPSYAQLEALSEAVRLYKWEGRERPILKELLTQLEKL